MAPDRELAAVFFDVGNTLLYPFPSVSRVCAELLSAAGHDRDLASIEELMPVVDAYYEERFHADDTFWAIEEATSQVWLGMYSLMCRRLGIADESESIARKVYEEFGRPERWAAYDDVRPALERLRAAGLRTGVISNWDGRLEGLLDGLGLSGLLDTVVSSASVGLHKPDPRIFELACARVGVDTGAAAHVGDHFYSDVLGATTAGMRAVLIDRRGAGGGAVAVPRIETLDELEGALS